MGKLDKAGLRRKLKDKAGLVCERHIFLCLGSNCEPSVGKQTWRLLGKRFKELAKQNRYFNRSELKCLSLCRNGPIAIVYPEGVYYSEVSPERAERIIEEHLLNGRVVEEWAFARVPLVQIETAGPHSALGRAEEKTMAEKTLKKGDKVEWDSSGGHSKGEVVEKVTKTTKVKGHTAKATKEEPQYKVKSDKSGKEAIHKAEELKKSK